MISSQTASKDSTPAKDKGKKGSEEGKVYEKLSLALLAKNGYELSKHNSKFCDFAIGREVGLGTDGKFDDNVFRYTDDDNTKQLIFVQIKHKQHDHPINSEALSADAATSKGGGDGGMRRDFNLQKYFISFLNVREELKKKSLSEECRNGNIQYVAIFTNVGLDKEELISKGFSFKAAPDDIIKLFTLTTQEHNSCYQLTKISEDLRNILMKSSDLHRVARELAQYVVWENYRENKIMGIDTTPIKQYHVRLARDVIRKSDQVESISSRKKTKNEPCCEVKFRDEFLENNEIGSKQELLNAVFEAIRELDESRKSLNDEELKKHLTRIKWKAVPNFGKTKKNKGMTLPCEWTTLKEDDVTDFLKCLVFAVNRPRVNELGTLFLYSVQDTVVDRHYSTSLREIVDKLQNAGPELRQRIEQDLVIYETTSFEEKWTSGVNIVKFLDDQKQQISVSFFVTAMTLIYESEVMHFGKFNESGKMGKCLDMFFSNDAKVLCVITPQTLLSSIKVLQYLNAKKDYIAGNGRIYTNFDILKSKENRKSVAKAFETERNGLLVIEYTHTVNEQDAEEFYKKLYSVVNAKPNKKIIIIKPEEERNNLLEDFQNDFQSKVNFMLEDDVIDVKYFDPKEDPFKKELIWFQGQDKRVSLSDITGIDSWPSYVHSLSQGIYEQGVIDGTILVEMLSNDEIEVGSKSAGTSSLDGAYAQMYEEINVETLASKLMSQEDDNNTNDMYIVSGITGSSDQDKTYKLIRYLGRNIENVELKVGLEEFKNRLKTVRVNNLQVFDHEFKDRNFLEICHMYPEKRIFWISLECGKSATKFMLQEIYNPKFYLKRKFKNVIIKKDLKEHLSKANLSETFIFHCVEDNQELYDYMVLNASEIENFENSCMIKIFSLKSAAETVFKEFSKQKQTVHLLEFEKKLLVWCDSHGSVQSLQKYIDEMQSETSLIEEDNLIRKIKGRKVVILADDPGMGKTTTLIKLYETESETSSIIKSHWVIRIQLRDNLKNFTDLKLKKDHIDTASLIEFLSKIDLKLNNQLAKNLMTIALDKSKHFPKSLLLVFDGFDEILDEEDRNTIILLLKFIKKKTAAKLWITTRLQFKETLENELSTIAVEFVSMDDQQKSEYIKTYLQHRLCLILSEKNFNRIYSCFNDREEIKSIHMYIYEFLHKMKKTFLGNISRFIGTPLQLHLMLEGSSKHFKKWLENDEVKIPVFNYVGHDIHEVYENFIDRKYDVYFEKVGIPEGKQRKQEKIYLDLHYKDFAKFRILALKHKMSLDEFLDKVILAGLIKFEVSESQFIHKTFEEFFAAKVFFHWIEKGSNHLSNTHKEEHLLKVILMIPNYRLIRTFMNLQLQKMTEQNREGKENNELDDTYTNYGNIAAKLLNQKSSSRIVATLHIAVEESNKYIASFLLKCLKSQPDALRKFLFTAGNYITPYYDGIERNALHIACRRDDFEMVKVLLDAAEGISEDTLQDFLRCLNGRNENALHVAAVNNHNVQILNELLSRANSKLDLILSENHNALCVVCFYQKEEFVDLLLQEFRHDKNSLKQLLLHNHKADNALYYTVANNICYTIGGTAIVEKLISASKSMSDNNETLKKLHLPKKGRLPLKISILKDNIDVVKILLNAAKDMYDDNRTLKMLLLKKIDGKSALDDAVTLGRSNMIKLFLDTTSDLGIDIWDKLITAVDVKGRNAMNFSLDYDVYRQEYFKTMKELLSYAMDMDDESATLKKLLTKLWWLYDKYGYRSEIKQMVEILTLETENYNGMHAVSILKEFDEKLTEVKHVSVRLNLFQRIFRRIRLHSDRGNDNSVSDTPSHSSYSSAEE